MDEKLEAAINEAGRERVFAFVRASGWLDGSPVPKYVWWGAVARVKSSGFRKLRTQ